MNLDIPQQIENLERVDRIIRLWIVFRCDLSGGARLGLHAVHLRILVQPRHPTR